MPQTIDLINFPFGPDVTQWPKLTCTQPGQLDLQDAGLRLPSSSDILFQDNGQIRSGDDTHRLVFDRTGGLLELHEAGAIRLLTGRPTPTERLRILATGEVGIGTATPTSQLHVTGDMRTDGALRVAGQAVVGGMLTVSGTVGIGTAMPTQTLEVVGTVKATAFQGNGAELTEVSGTDTTKVAKTGDTMTGPLSITADGIGLSVTNNAAVGGTLTVVRNVGIGTTEPDHVLVVGPPSGGRHLVVNDIPTARWGFATGNFNLAIQNDGSGTWETRLLIAKNGNVGIGTAGPTHRFHVLAPDAVGLFESTGTQAYLRLSTSEGINNRVEITNRPGGNLTLWTAGAGDVFTITRDGQILLGNNRTGPFVRLNDDVWFSDPQNGTIHVRNGNNGNWGQLVGVFNNMSSRAHKKAITTLRAPDCDRLLNDALHTNLVTFRYKGDDDQHRLRLGVISEESPSYIVGDDGESLSSSEYIAMLHGAIKALANRLVALEEKVTAITG